MSALSELEAMLLAGGVYMIPIVVLGTCLFGSTLQRLWRGLSAMRDLRLLLEGSVFTLSSSPWLVELGYRYMVLRSGNRRVDDALRGALSQGFLERLGINGSSILLCSSLATLCGLLGTVSGMIASFEAMQRYGIFEARAMAGGIAEALITTQSGLLVGIAGLLCGKGVSSLKRRLETRLQGFYLALEQHLCQTGGQE